MRPERARNEGRTGRTERAPTTLGQKGSNDGGTYSAMPSILAGALLRWTVLFHMLSPRAMASTVMRVVPEKVCLITTTPQIDSFPSSRGSDFRREG